MIKAPALSLSEKEPGLCVGLVVLEQQVREERPVVDEEERGCGYHCRSDNRPDFHPQRGKESDIAAHLRTIIPLSRKDPIGTLAGTESDVVSCRKRHCLLLLYIDSFILYHVYYILQVSVCWV